ncbi:MAG: hypothetical protein DRQ49_17505 [Gammaproteobacteria bacterium]|nr:MAG: hypothetical protein DRQ49_17505 [Gammaproteobacteria bacterium]
MVSTNLQLGWNIAIVSRLVREIQNDYELFTQTSEEKYLKSIKIATTTVSKILTNNFKLITEK